MKQIHYYTIQDNKTGELFSYNDRTRIYENELDEVLCHLYGGKDIITRAKENITVVRHGGYGF